MNSLISIVEIPTADFLRAVNFYQTILNLEIEQVDMGEIKMGILPGDDQAVNVALVNGADYKPSHNGTLVYFNGGNDLQPLLESIVQNGGQIILGKTEISPEMGYFALFADTEGNKLGLYSKS